MTTVYTPPVNTYTPLGSITLSGGETEVVLTGFSQDYRDLVLIVAGSSTTASGLEAKLNGSTAGMETVYMYGAGSGSGVSGSANGVAIVGQIDSSGGITTTHFLDYSATDKHKTFLTRGSRSGIVVAYANRWASTDAITSIGMTMQAGSLNSGTVISLYGIKA